MENFATLFEEQRSQMVAQEGQLLDAKIITIGAKYITVDAGLKSESNIPLSEFKDLQNDNGELTLQVGDVIKVAIDSAEDRNAETKLSYEKAQRIAAWEELEQALNDNSVLTGFIYGRVKGGLGVTYKGVRLFLPGSLLDVRTVRDFGPYEGKNIDFKVIKIDRQRNNIVVSRKAALTDRSEEDSKLILEKMQKDAIVKGVVKNLTDYGAFVDLGGVDGLIYITDLSWKRVKHPSEILTVGQELEVKVLKFDEEKNRVSLGLKQLTEDPWSLIAENYPAGTRLYGKISNITDYGAFVEIQNGVEGLVHVSEMSWGNKITHPSKLVIIGDEVQVQVLSVDADKRRISLGLKQCLPNPWLAFSEKYNIGDQITGKIHFITDFGFFIRLDGAIDGLVHVSDISWHKADDVAAADYSIDQTITVKILSIDTKKDRIALGLKQLETDAYATFLNANFASKDKTNVIHATVKSVADTEVIVQLAPEIEGVLRDSANKNNDLTKTLTVEQNVEVFITSVDKAQQKIYVSLKKAREQSEKNETKNTADKAVNTPTTSLGVLLQDKFPQQS